MRPAPSRLKRRLLFITLGTLIAAGAATAVLMGDATPEVAEAAEDTAPAGGEAPRVVTTAPTEDGLVTTTSEPELLGTNLGGITPTWTHVSTAPAYEWSYDVVATAQRTLYVTGYVQDAGQDLQVAKYVDGTQRWARSYAGPAGGSDWGEVIAARGGRIYTAGSRQTKWGDQDLLLIRWDGNGNRVWTRAYDSGSRSVDRAVDVAVDGDGNVIVVGSSHRPATGWDWVVLSYRADGTRRWVQRYDGPSHLDDKPAKMLIDSRDRIYVAGVSRSAVRYDDALLVKYSQSGSRLWAKRFDGSADHADAARSLCARPGGGVYVCGYTSSIGTGVNGLLLAYSGAGSRLFTTVEDRYDAGTSTQVFQDVAVRRGGEIVCGGFDQLSGPDTDVLYGFYSPEGSLRWLTHWYSDWNDQLTALARDGQGGVYLTGTYGTASGPQVFTQHLCAGGTDWYCLWPSVPSVGHEPMAIAVNGVNAYVVGSNGAGDRFVVGHVY